MSLQGFLWVQEQAPTQSSTELAVLYAMANYVDPAGHGCYASQSSLAERARCDVRTLRRHLKELENRGVIRRGDQQMVSHFPARHRPIVWDLNLTLTSGKARSDNMTGRESDRTSDTIRPDIGGTSDGTRVSDNPSLLPTVEEPSLNTTDANGFEEFYAAYPRKSGKGAARAAYVKALRKVDAQTVIDGATRYADDPNREPGQWTKHPTTWLNSECWDDEPLPVRRSSSRPSSDERVKAALSLQRPEFEDCDPAFAPPRIGLAATLPRRKEISP